MGSVCFLLLLSQVLGEVSVTVLTALLMGLAHILQLQSGPPGMAQCTAELNLRYSLSLHSALTTAFLSACLLGVFEPFLTAALLCSFHFLSLSLFSPD